MVVFACTGVLGGSVGSPAQASARALLESLDGQVKNLTAERDSLRVAYSGACDALAHARAGMQEACEVCLCVYLRVCVCVCVCVPVYVCAFVRECLCTCSRVCSLCTGMCRASRCGLILARVWSVTLPGLY